MPEPLSKNELAIGKQYVDRVIDLINGAKRSIDIFMFDWRWAKNDISSDVSLINQSLVRATRRGVIVRAFCNYTAITKILNEVGIKAKSWNSTKLMHSKAIILDQKIVVMGSHNFTMNAMNENIETSVIMEDEALGTQLTNYFNTLWS